MFDITKPKLEEPPEHTLYEIRLFDTLASQNSGGTLYMRSEDMNYYLKPCPFCGKEPYSKICVLRGRAYDHIAIEIGCLACGYKHSTEIQSGECLEKLEEAVKTASNKWNGRV